VALARSERAREELVASNRSRDVEIKALQESIAVRDRDLACKVSKRARERVSKPSVWCAERVCLLVFIDVLLIFSHRQPT
jgi:hypothetical protein